MDKDTIVYDPRVVTAVLAWIEETCAMHGIPVNYEELTLGNDNVSLSTAPGTTYLKLYKSGGFISNFDFEIYYRCYVRDTRDRIGALELLGDIVRKIEGLDFPQAPEGVIWTGMAVKLLPHPFSRESTYTDYQMTASLGYIKKRG